MGIFLYCLWAYLTGQYAEYCKGRSYWVWFPLTMFFPPATFVLMLLPSHR